MKEDDDNDDWSDLERRLNIIRGVESVEDEEVTIACGVNVNIEDDETPIDDRRNDPNNNPNVIPPGVQSLDKDKHINDNTPNSSNINGEELADMISAKVLDHLGLKGKSIKGAVAEALEEMNKTSDDTTKEYDGNWIESDD